MVFFKFCLSGKNSVQNFFICSILEQILILHNFKLSNVGKDNFLIVFSQIIAFCSSW